MEYGLGIDVGTTFTAAAVRTGSRVEVVRLGVSRAEIPSLVFVRDDGEVLVGDAAERRGAAEPGRLAREFKRRVGDPVAILVGGAPYSAHALMARVFRYVVDTVSRLQEGPPASITVTHPANWGPYKRELLTQAIRLAGIDGAMPKPEPEAAAMQYAASERVQTEEIVAVYDLGGGTFDAAVLRKTATGFEVLGEPDGIEQLGGIDFDEAVFSHVIGNLGDALGQLDPNDDAVTEALARLRRDCVAAKEALSFDTDVMIPVALPGRHTRVRLNRSEFEAMIAPTLADTVAATQRALRSAQVAPEDLKSVLLAGGSSRIPLVGQLLSAELDRPVLLDPHPEHSIALGAALSTAPAPARVTATARVPVPVAVPEAEPEAEAEAEQEAEAAPAEPEPALALTGAPEPARRRSLVVWMKQSPRRLSVGLTVLVAALAGTGLWFVLNASASESNHGPATPSKASTAATPTPTPSPSLSPTVIAETFVPQPTRTQQQPPVVNVRVPNVVGLSEQRARDTLTNAGLTVQVTTRPDNSRPAGTVVGTSPGAGTLVSSGSRVTMTVAKAVQPTTSSPKTSSPPKTTPPPSLRP